MNISIVLIFLGEGKGEGLEIIFEYDFLFSSGGYP